MFCTSLHKNKAYKNTISVAIMQRDMVFVSVILYLTGFAPAFS